MASRKDAVSQYTKALKQGRKTYKDCILHGRYPYPQVLDEILSDSLTAGQVDLGVLEIPMEVLVAPRTDENP